MRLHQHFASPGTEELIGLKIGDLGIHKLDVVSVKDTSAPCNRLNSDEEILKDLLRRWSK
jgi:hypothetical protein